MLIPIKVTKSEINSCLITTHKWNLLYVLYYIFTWNVVFHHVGLLWRLHSSWLRTCNLLRVIHEVFVSRWMMWKIIRKHTGVEECREPCTVINCNLEGALDMWLGFRYHDNGHVLVLCRYSVILYILFNLISWLAVVVLSFFYVASFQPSFHKDTVSNLEVNHKYKVSCTMISFLITGVCTLKCSFFSTFKN